MLTLQCRAQRNHELRPLYKLLHGVQAAVDGCHVPQGPADPLPYQPPATCAGTLLSPIAVMRFLKCHSEEGIMSNLATNHPHKC